MTDNFPTAIKVQHLTKTFKIPLEAHSGIKQKVINQLKGRKGYRDFTPLNDVSFEIKQGDFFGIVGRNGSGKSTLLKTIAGIYTPQKGSVTVEGSLIPFIELGVGFNAELSGRENVYLNGALLGFSHAEMELMYDEIVDFAELHDFMEERIKNYSSGMQVRLAFSIAIRAQGDILLLDEVLAVGDQSFQRKCYNYFADLKRNQKTVILVSHDMSSIERFCNKAIFIENGQITASGSPYEIAEYYNRANENTLSKAKTTPKPSGVQASLHKLGSLEQEDSFDYGQDIVIRASWKSNDIKNVGVAIIRRDGEYVFGSNTYKSKYDVNGAKEVEYTVTANLMDGDYFIKVGFFGENDAEKIQFIEEGPSFNVRRDYDGNDWGGITKLRHHWGSKNV